MNKILNIGWKDLITTFRDPAALVLMLITPLALTLAMAFAFGGFGDHGANGTGLSDIPVVVVNHDDGELGARLVEFLASDQLEELLDPISGEDAPEARAAVDADEAAAAIIIPEDLTARVIPSPGGTNASPETAETAIEVYANPTRPVSVGVVRSVVDAFTSRVNATTASVEVTLSQLIQGGLIAPEQAVRIAPDLVERTAGDLAEIDLLRVVSQDPSADEEAGFNWMAYMAPSMAILFLMFTVTAGGRSILTERDEGTLSRMLTTRSSSVQVLAGKVFGTYLTGLAQMGTLVVASTIIFGMTWGAPLAVIVLLVALVAAATGWGIVIAAYARTAAQANVIGTAVTLVFGIGAGHFFPRQLLPGWLRTLSFVSPNAWGLEAFAELGDGAGLGDIVTPIGALVAMAVLAFGAASILFRRQVRQ